MDECIRIIGIDCAVDPQKAGLTHGIYWDGQIAIQEILLGNRKKSIAKMVFEMCQNHNKCLIAFDAPLGWPKEMGRELVNHCAGDSLIVGDKVLFRRETDRFIKRMIGKQPLDIGADRIARTAYTALKILRELGEYSGNPIPLAWNCKEIKKYLQSKSILGQLLRVITSQIPNIKIMG